jgi:6-phosphogluconolactonase/glucosamine-6-phosphate isomerase/deaminase
MAQMDLVKSILQKQNIFSHENEGILVGRVKDAGEGFLLAHDVVLEMCNSQTVLYLSGGRTPKEFYEMLSTEDALEVGTVGLVDERFGGRFHENSNEKMIMDTGLLQSLDKKGVAFHPILTGSSDMHVTAEEYDQTVRSLHATYQQSIGILGVGVDGHTAGLPARISNIQYPISNLENDYSYVIAYDYPVGVYGKRITQTFLGLSMMDFLLVMVFGEDKKDALQKMFSEGSEEEIPSRFYKRQDIAPKTLLITDCL